MDHTMVDVRALKVKPKRGTDLPRVNEAIFDDPAFLATLASAIAHARAQIDTTKPDGWRS